MSYTVLREFPGLGYEHDEELGTFDSVLEATACANVRANEASEHEEYVVYDAENNEVFWTPGKVQCPDVRHIDETTCPSVLEPAPSPSNGEGEGR